MRKKLSFLICVSFSIEKAVSVRSVKMAKSLCYIVLLTIIPYLAFASKESFLKRGRWTPLAARAFLRPDSAFAALDTVKKQNDDKKKIKEVNKARHVPKPEKVAGESGKRPHRMRRPPGLERPPEIPRHNGN